ncbi:GlcNAc-PI de-N-acetylase [Deinococcus irradiatisoli]|uniref:GlcNAc-PI de-N-acetylase n=1 Tax=Deinococcus irradiatisoli TaxID=2202254 RepID=A0A2Z3JL08_9DEIO|nr:PIG-L deacetylase family protein [Deinococcus irradiatisoli]AWN24231.1 GlcNAc-PI de-N-acetylase [Deinococcus irradiatisoli]
MNLLAVFSHPDDECGCAATLAKHARRGDRVMIVWTTYGEMSSKFSGVPRDEVKRVREGWASDVAGIIGAEHRFFDMGDTRMQGSREEALHLARLYAEFQPDAVITWDDKGGTFTPHPDHCATAKIAYDAVVLARLPKALMEGQGDLVQEPEAHRREVNFYQYAQYGAPDPTLPIVHVEVGDTIEVAAQVYGYYARHMHGNPAAFPLERFKIGRSSQAHLTGTPFTEKFSVKRMYHPAVPYLL